MRPLVLLDWNVLGYTPTGHLGDAQPVEGGGDIYRMLSATWRTVVLYTGLDTEEMVETWLRREGLRSHVGLLVHQAISAVHPITWKLQQVRTLRTEGNREILYVDVDPQAVAAVIRDGVPSVLLSFPAFISPDWHPDASKTPKPWDAVVHEIELQRDA